MDTKRSSVRATFALAVLLTGTACDERPGTATGLLEQSIRTGETHPYQSRLACKRAPGSTLVGVMLDLSSDAPAPIAQFSSGGNVGACELAIRAARDNKVCVPGPYAGFTIRDLTTGTKSGNYSTLNACTNVTRGAPVLATEPGYVDFIAPQELAPFRAALPQVDDPAITSVLQNPRTMFYDESSLVFVYQDSFGDPKGLRANRVGYDVGITSSVPDIFALTEYFQPLKFKFPFALTAGATFDDNVYALYFWAPPADDEGMVHPVRIWKNNSHWHWVFPVGTVIGEILFIQAPDDQAWFPFEIRTRVRTTTGWSTGIFRPYVTALELAEEVKSKRPTWATDSNVAPLVEHLESPTTLTPFTLEAPDYAKIFPAMHGAMDYLPETADTDLIKELLTGRLFSNAMGTSWKENDTLRTFAASTHATFHIVPAEYPAGMFETSEAGCRDCHDQTSRPLNNLDPRVVLYGEVWGEDEIFTWHPFAIDTSTFGVADGNRHVNQRMLAAGLVEMATPASKPDIYTILPKPYTAKYD